MTNSMVFFLLMGAAGLTLLLRLIFSLFVLLRAGKEKGSTHSDDGFPPISVIVAARNEAENLKQFLPKILAQDYPDFELVVVDDCSVDNSREVLAELQLSYPQLKVSWVPENAVQRRGKKLALSIGIKAAQNEWLVFTDADCYPATDKWLSQLAAKMTESTDFVLAYGAYNYEKSGLNALIRFDTLKIAMRYAGYASLGQVYMGVGRNLVYRRSLWFEHRGFAGFNQIASGDDDLFVNAYAKSERTALCFNEMSKTISVPAKQFKQWRDQKTRHMSTSKYYSPFLRFLLVFEPINQMISILLVLLFAFMFWGTYESYAALALYLIVKIVEAIVARKFAKRTGEKLSILNSMFLDGILPLIYIIFAFSRNKIARDRSWK